jgi:hypothetical protein
VQILRRNESVVFMTTIEDWMVNQTHTELFNFSDTHASAAEMELTEVLDDLLSQVLYRIPNIDWTVDQVRAQKAQPVKGRRAQEGEQSLGSLLGRTYDDRIKALVRQELRIGRLKNFSGQLQIVDQGDKGPDFWMRSSSLVAWDVTSRGDLKKHINRDVYGRGYNRYYLLIWDEPRTEPARLVREIQRAALASSGGDSGS